MLKIAMLVGLTLEVFLGVLIWVEKLRCILLALGLMSHLCLEYYLNVPLFAGMSCPHAFSLFVDLGTWRALAIGSGVVLPRTPVGRDLPPSPLCKFWNPQGKRSQFNVEAARLN
jgi:hypothetical protein